MKITRDKLFHVGHEYGHLGYFAFVAIEAHSTYGYIAGMLFCLTLARLVFHVSEQ